MWNRSLILFPNPWMCNEQLTQCFALWITVKFKKHSCKFCYTHSMWVLTSWLQQNVHILCFLLHGTSLKLTVIQAVLHHTHTCAHSDTTPHTHRALSTVPEIPCPFCEAFSPSQGNRAMEDSQTCSSSDDNNHKTTRIRRKTSGTGFHQTLPIPSLWHPEALAPERERSSNGSGTRAEKAARRGWFQRWRFSEDWVQHEFNDGRQSPGGDGGVSIPRLGDASFRERWNDRALKAGKTHSVTSDAPNWPRGGGWGWAEVGGGSSLCNLSCLMLVCDYQYQLNTPSNQPATAHVLSINNSLIFISYNNQHAICCGSNLIQALSMTFLTCRMYAWALSCLALTDWV